MTQRDPIPLGMKDECFKFTSIVSSRRTFLIVDCTSTKGDRCLIELHPRQLGRAEASWYYRDDPISRSEGSDQDLYDWLERFRDDPNANVLEFRKP